MAHLLITRGRSYNNRSGVMELLLNLKLGKITITFTVILMLIGVSFSYLLISNEQITMGYRINELKASKAYLTEEQEHLAVEVDKAIALINVENAALKKGMLVNNMFTYVESDGEVAQR